MKRTGSLLIVLLLMLASFTAGMKNPRGDVDHDGQVSISDVTALIDYLLTGDAVGISSVNADCDQDGLVNISDVTSLIDRLLTGTWGDPVTPPDEHEWVDLGLPSGTLWATCNIGASSPEDYGDYFAWGETVPKWTYNWETYEWCECKPFNVRMTKYCDDYTNGTVELEPEDDAAYMNWGPSWRMPTLSQLEEIRGICTHEPTMMNGVQGFLFTGPNGNSMFLPAAGCRKEDSLLDGGTIGSYWSCTLGYYSNQADMLYFNGMTVAGANYSHSARLYGYTVRPVRVSQN